MTPLNSKAGLALRHNAIFDRAGMSAHTPMFGQVDHHILPTISSPSPKILQDGAKQEADIWEILVHSYSPLSFRPDNGRRRLSGGEKVFPQWKK